MQIQEGLEAFTLRSLITSELQEARLGSLAEFTSGLDVLEGIHAVVEQVRDGHAANEEVGELSHGFQMEAQCFREI